MSASGFFPNLDRKGTVYLCIVVCKWQFEGAQETQGVFAQKLELANLADPVDCVAKAIFSLMIPMMLGMMAIVVNNVAGAFFVAAPRGVHQRAAQRRIDLAIEVKIGRAHV